MRPSRALLALLVALVTVPATACDPDGAKAQRPASSPSVRTLEPLPAPPSQPPTGRLYADLRQSSRDAALGRMQVWIVNDTRRDLVPTRISYRDPRLGRPVTGERLRLNPPGGERGYPLRLPRRPACSTPGSEHGHGALLLAQGHGAERLRVDDPTDIVGRYVAARCLELSVAEVAEVRFADTVRVRRSGAAAAGVLTLVVDPVDRPVGEGRAPERLTVTSVGGTPVLTPFGRSVWEPGVTVRRHGRTQRIPLPVVPARCDPHAFLESGGATAFRVKVRLDGRPGELVLRMSPAGAAAAIGFAADACGLS